MKIQQLLDHHRIARNPFADEDAQTDPVFKDYCIDTTYHPTWDKVFGDPREPSTSIVFGEKGSGKTAMRLQIAKHIENFNERHPGKRLFVIHYDDLNHFLDRFRDKFSSRKRVDRVLASFKLWDHMDGILSLGVTGLVDRILEVKHPSTQVNAEISQNDVDDLDRNQARDLLLLAACYDQSTAETVKGRWHRLRRRLKFRTWTTHWDLALGIGWTALMFLLVVVLIAYGYGGNLLSPWLYIPLLIAAVAGWVPWLRRFWNCFWLSRGVATHMRVGNHDRRSLRQILMDFKSAELAGQPLPNKDRTDDRYENLCKFQGIIDSLGYAGIIVLVDRIDEPHLIDGSAEMMKALLWPMLDNKFLKHPGVGLKLMLPIELTRFIDREDRQFYQRARLDKQNMIPSFEWTGEALFDVADARIRACASDGASPSLRDLFDPAVSDKRLLDALRTLRVPRNLFKFLYRLLVAHCNTHTDKDPAWTISSETFEATLALYNRDQDAFHRGVGSG